MRGRWFITPHAVKQYIERQNLCVTYENALEELIALSHKARRVKPWKDGAVLYRGPKPRRLRFIVSEQVSAKCPLPQLLTVYGGRDPGYGPERGEVRT